MAAMSGIGQRIVASPQARTAADSDGEKSRPGQEGMYAESANARRKPSEAIRQAIPCKIVPSLNIAGCRERSVPSSLAMVPRKLNPGKNGAAAAWEP